MLIFPTVQRRAIVTALSGVGDLLDGLLVKLFQNNYTPHAKTVVGDLEVADFVGYAPSTAVVWGAVFDDLNDAAVIVGDVKQFLCTAATTPNVIYGYWLSTGAGALVAAEKFDAPVNVAEAFDPVIVLPRFSFGQ